MISMNFSMEAKKRLFGVWSAKAEFQDASKGHKDPEQKCRGPL
jgi:hypothetical protein